MLRRILGAIDRSVSAAVTGFSRIAAGVIMLLMFLTTADVTGRYVFDSPVLAAYEISEVMLIAVVYLGLAYVQSVKGHVKVDIVTSWLPQRAQLALDILGYAVGLFIIAMITWQSSLIAWKAWVTHDHIRGLVNIPYWPGRSLVTIGAGLFCVQLLANIIKDSARLLRGATTE